MTVAAAALVLGIVLVTLAAVAWVWAWAEPDANGLARDHLTALADWALVALALHALALVFGGTAGLGAYVVTFVLAGAAAVLRRPPGAQAAPTELAARAAPSAGRSACHRAGGRGRATAPAGARAAARHALGEALASWPARARFGGRGHRAPCATGPRAWRRAG